MVSFTEENHMIVEKGMQQNCSELIIRLEAYDSVDNIKEELEKIDIREYVLKNYYDWDWAPKEQTQWDTEDHGKGIIPVKDLPKKVQKLLLKSEDYDNDEEQGEARKELKEIGINKSNSVVVLLDGTKPLVMPNGTISIYKEHDGGGPAIVGHQHCNWDMFPILKKISDHFGEEVHAYDGGSIDEYNRFLDGKELEE